MSRSTDKYHFFWNSKLSQWSTSPFVNRIHLIEKYNCAEQYMMYMKAILFNDFETAKRIYQSKYPREMQALGRQVKGYDQKIWNEWKYQIVVDGNILKFQQNPILKKMLFDTYPLQLVEASPVDKVWGVGLAEDDPLIDDENNWQGENLLGKALTEVRNTLMKEEGLI